GRGRAKVAHAVVVIFLEFFAWGLLTTPMLTVSKQQHLRLLWWTSGVFFVARSPWELPDFCFFSLGFPVSGSPRDVPSAHFSDERSGSGREGETFTRGAPGSDGSRSSLSCGWRRVGLGRVCVLRLWTSFLLSGLPVVPLGSTDRSSVGYLGEEILPPPHRFLHLCPHPLHEDQPMVLLCSDLAVGDLRRDLLRDLCLRGRHHRGAGEEHRYGLVRLPQPSGTSLVQDYPATLAFSTLFKSISIVLFLFLLQKISNLNTAFLNGLSFLDDCSNIFNHTLSHISPKTEPSWGNVLARRLAGAWMKVLNRPFHRATKCVS
ncbi:unnamed protein product, partial [Tetraodon nigroviridis]